jgi:Zn-dependent peptidase ImmA (M78 family)
MPTRTEAEKAASDLLKIAWGDDLARCALPVDPFHIADRLGLQVYATTLEPDVSGMLIKQADEDAKVYVNVADSENRQRFSCAHEIGHYVKRVSSRADDAWGYIDRRGPSAARGDNPDEIYANQFAAGLLMPEERVRSMSADLGPAALAAHFRVSVEAMKFRFDNLGIPY